MFLSVFDIFKIGVGPSSSHTMGPMLAAARFLDELREGSRIPGGGAPASARCRLHGSLAFTGKGHATDRAVTLGLAGFRPDMVDLAAAEAALALVAAERTVRPEGLELVFDPARDIVFDYGPPLPLHTNALVLEADDARGNLAHRQTYYSIGGGFVKTEAEMRASDRLVEPAAGKAVPYPFASAAEMLDMARRSGLSIAAMKRANEEARMSRAELDAGLDRLLAVMDDTIERGIAAEGILPGGLNVRRRAPDIHRQLVEERGRNLVVPHVANDWLSVYAMAVNEENAAGGQVVTAPTNGAAGVVPAVLRYYRDHIVGSTAGGRRDMLLTAAAIGGLVKHNASISGAECGCQAEVGSASAMAAGALCGALGGSPAQVENAAEIALEHHLGMTCDPIRGLVQVPCIERNGLGAIKAVSAASLGLRGDGTHLVSLDACIRTMKETGRDMSEKYKETSLGGLAVNVPEC
jgi:L-serine dehydratase